MKLKKAYELGISLLALLWIASVFWPHKDEAIQTTPEQLVLRIQADWKNLRSKNLVHGVIAISQKGKIIFSDGELDKAYPIGSMSKSFTGKLFEQKFQQGQLKPSDRVCQWIPSFCHGMLAQITLEQMLTHRSGLPRDLHIWSGVSRSWNQSTLSDIASEPVDESVLRSAPGTKFLYSNYGFILLSRILEIVDSRSYANQIAGIAQIAGLQDASVINASSLISRQLLVPFIGDGMSLKMVSGVAYSYGAGAVQTSARDLIQWLKIYQTSDRKDYGWIQSKEQSYRAYWHNGAYVGLYSLMAVLPEHDLQIVILTDNFKFEEFWNKQVTQFQNYFY
ncbi:serine hydrolase domain-containing protein [Bdellovibrio sp. HCB2-146]|uniref:serine hydrolase domain-containing protein n=1 Tax=Bdellovibrio sp. HCB2-146 TaxID=3394362 RepID=UPI0039BD389C